MSKKLAKRSDSINRRQFIIKSTLGVCGLGAAYGTAKVAFSSNPQGKPSFQSDDSERIDIPPYNENARFLKPHQYAVVATIAALIVPTDDEPGATEAGVVDHIDTVVASSEKKQKLYTNGLNWLDRFCQKKYGDTFLNIARVKQMDILSLQYDMFQGTSLYIRVGRKLFDIWGGITGSRLNRRFLRAIHKDVVEGFYANPVSWQQVGYFGPPNPVGYPDFSEPPSAKHYARTVRLVDNVSCNTCHEVGEHPRGGLIDHTCTACHRPHSPWPHDKSSFYLEDNIGAVFSNPDRENVKQGD